MDSNNQVGAANTIGAGSLHRLKVFEKCPKQAYFMFVAKRPEPATVDKTAANRGIELHTAAEKFIKGEAANAPGLEKFTEILEENRALFETGKAEVEENWGFSADWSQCDYWDPGVWLRIKCDVVQHLSPTHIQILDWKSGRKDGNEVAHIGQGQLYSIAAFMRNPDVDTVTVRFHYLDHPKEKLVRDYKRAQLPSYLASWDKRLKRMTSATVFQAKPNRFTCAYCAFSGNRGGDASCESRVDV